jgi:hypothetical protein
VVDFFDPAGLVSGLISGLVCGCYWASCAGVQWVSVHLWPELNREAPGWLGAVVVPALVIPPYLLAAMLLG